MHIICYLERLEKKFWREILLRLSCNKETRDVLKHSIIRNFIIYNCTRFLSKIERNSASSIPTTELEMKTPEQKSTSRNQETSKKKESDSTNEDNDLENISPDLDHIVA